MLCIYVEINTHFIPLSVAFKMYDLDDDGVISRDELLSILHMMVGANISQDQLTSIAERTILEADLCCQGKISFEDFCKALERTDVEQKMSIRFLNWTSDSQFLLRACLTLCKNMPKKSRNVCSIVELLNSKVLQI